LNFLWILSSPSRIRPPFDLYFLELYIQLSEVQEYLYAADSPSTKDDKTIAYGTEILKNGA